MQQTSEVKPAALSVSVIRLLLDVMRNDVIHGDRCCRLIGDELVSTYESQLREWIISCHQRRNKVHNINTSTNDDDGGIAKEEAIHTIYVIENEVANAINSYCIRHFLLSAPQLLLVSEGGIALSLRLLAQRIREEGNVEFVKAAQEIEEEVEQLTHALDTRRYAHLIDLLGEIVILYMLRAHVFASHVDHDASICSSTSVNQVLYTKSKHDARLESQEEQEKEKQNRLSSFLVHSIQSTVYQFAFEAVKERRRVEQARQQLLNTQADHVLFNVHTPEPEQEEQTLKESNNVHNHKKNCNTNKENIKCSTHMHPEVTKRKRTLHQLPRSSTDVRKMECALHHDNMLNVSNNNNNNNNKKKGDNGHIRNSTNSNSNGNEHQKEANSTLDMSSFASSLPTIDESDVNMNSATEQIVDGQVTQSSHVHSQRVKHLYVPANDSHENLSFGEDKASSKGDNSINVEVNNPRVADNNVDNANDKEVLVDHVRQFELDETGTRYVLVNTVRAVATTNITK